MDMTYIFDGVLTPKRRILLALLVVNCLLTLFWQFVLGPFQTVRIVLLSTAISAMLILLEWRERKKSESVSERRGFEVHQREEK